jgi:hypothetical protein
VVEGSLSRSELSTWQKRKKRKRKNRNVFEIGARQRQE